MRFLPPLVVLFVATLAGCIDNDGELDDILEDIDVMIPQFTEPLIIDATRAGGEPVIAITHQGTILVAAHPGWTHYHPPGGDNLPDELITPASGQSYLWRSTDGGATWAHIGLPGTTEGPRSTGFGVSDPEFTVMEDNTVCYTDLMALATSSVVCSTDDGQTWLPGNEFASGGPNDRQWLASHGKELYFTANYFADHHIRVSTDRGLTWEDRGDVPCSHDLVANPLNGHLVVGCPDGIAVSHDGGWTWEHRTAPGGAGGQRIMAEPAIDGAGVIWMVFVDGERDVWVMGTADEGATWPWRVDVGSFYREQIGDHGTYVWPWISAGSAGRFAVSWIGSEHHEDSAENEGPWFIESISVVNAVGPVAWGPGGDGYTVAEEAPEMKMFYTRLTPDPIHVQPICQSGTVCQVGSVQGDPASDRRLGDFFETTIDHEGNLHGVWSNTAEAADDVISHAQYVRQTGGVSLVEGPLHWGFPTQG